MAWSRLVLACGIQAVAALTRLKTAALMQMESTAEVVLGSVTEAVKVAKRARIPLIYDDPLAKVKAVCESAADSRCGMLEDILAGKRTEIDFLNGVVVRQGRSYGIPTPVNQLLVNLVKTIETSKSREK